jgi:RNA-binding protein 39
MVQYKEFGDGVKAVQHWNNKFLGGRALVVEMAPLPAAMPGLLPGMELLGMSGALPGMLPGAVDPAAFMAQQLAAQQQQVQLQQINELDEADEEGKGGLKLDAQKRVALMQRLAAAAGLETKPAMGMPTMPSAPAAAAAPLVPQVLQGVQLDQGLLGPASPIPTPAILLKNMFDPAEEEAKGDPNWVVEVESDVKEECSRFGEVAHIQVDRNSKVGLGRKDWCGCFMDRNVTWPLGMQMTNLIIFV